MFVAFCDHVAGNSTSSCSNTEPIRASRRSHSTVSNGCTPGRVNRRRTVSASPVRDSVLRAVWGVWSIVSCSFQVFRLVGRRRHGVGGGWGRWILLLVPDGTERRSRSLGGFAALSP